MKASRATHNLGRKGDKKVSNIKLFLEGFAAELAPKLKLNEWKKHELEEDLRAAGMGEITPELFVARAATKALFIGMFAIPAFFIFKILGLLVLGVAVFVYFGETKGFSGVKIMGTDFTEKAEAGSKILETCKSTFTILQTTAHFPLPNEVLSPVEFSVHSYCFTPCIPRLILEALSIRFIS